MNIDEMPAGPEMDALIAEKVFEEPCPLIIFPAEMVVNNHCMGAPPLESPKGAWQCLVDYSKGDVPFWAPKCFSSHDAVAIEVIRKLESESAIEISNYIESLEDEETKWWCEIIKGNDFGTANGETIAVAVCRAALKAVEAINA